MKALFLRSRWLMLLPMAVGVAFLVHLNIVNRVSDLLDEHGLEVLLRKQILHIISSDTPGEENSKTQSEALEAGKDMPGIVSRKASADRGRNDLILLIKT